MISLKVMLFINKKYIPDECPLKSTTIEVSLLYVLSRHLPNRSYSVITLSPVMLLTLYLVLDNLYNFISS